VKLTELAARLECRLEGDGELDVTRVGDDTIGLEHTPPEPLLGLEMTQLDDDGDFPRESPSGSLAGLEFTSLGGDESAFTSGATATQEAEPRDDAGDEPAQDDADSDGDELEFIAPTEQRDAAPRRPTPTLQEANAALAGLPMMDLEPSPTLTSFTRDCRRAGRGAGRGWRRPSPGPDRR